MNAQMVQTNFWIEPAAIKVVKPKPIHDYSQRELVARVLHLGAGRQSSCIAEMIVEGDLPRVDLVIFADTGDEPSWVYEQVWYLGGRLAGVNIPLMIVNRKDGRGIIEAAQFPGARFAKMPLYTGERGCKQGILQRQCTKEFKIEPGDDQVRAWLLERGHAKMNKTGARCVSRKVYIENWYGISADETYRAGKRGPGWQKAVYPLINMGMRTADCIRYLQEHGLRVPKKSSCIVCPYHDDEYWLDLKMNYPIDFEHACTFDDWLRSDAAKQKIKSLRQDCWLHVTCIPLREVDFVARIENRRRGPVSPFQTELIVGATCATDGGYSCMS